MANKYGKTRYEKFKEAFTKEQLDYLLKNHKGLTKDIKSDQEALAVAASTLMRHRQFGNQDEVVNLAKLMKDTQTPDFQALATTAGFQGKDAEADFSNAIAHEQDLAKRLQMKALLREKYGVAGWDLAKDQFKEYEHAKMLDEIQKEKARNVAEFSRTPAGIALAIGAPTMYQEGVRQALSDEPINNKRLWGAYGLDAATMGLMATTLPVASPIKATVGIGLEETGRQELAHALLGQDFDPSAPVGAMLAGATVPGAVRGLSRTVMQSSNPAMKKAGKAMMRGAKGYESPMDAEASELRDLVLQVRKGERMDQSKMTAMEIAGHNERKALLAQKLEALGYTDASLSDIGKEIAKPETNPLKSFIQVESMKERAAMNEPIGRKYSVAQVLNPGPEATDKAVLKDVMKSYRDPSPIFKVGEAKVGDPSLQTSAPYLLATQKNAVKRMDAVRDQFPTKYGVETGAIENFKIPTAKQWFGMWKNPGEATMYNVGRVLGGGAGTVEAATRVNPLTVVSELTSGGKGNVGRSRTEDFRNAEWYKQLKKNNPAMAKELDKALKGEEEE